MSRREPEDGSCYYTGWRVDIDWVDTCKLFQYRLNMEEEEAEPVTEQQVEDNRIQEARWWQSRQRTDS